MPRLARTTNRKLHRSGPRLAIGNTFGCGGSPDDRIEGRPGGQAAQLTFIGSNHYAHPVHEFAVMLSQRVDRGPRIGEQSRGSPGIARFHERLARQPEPTQTTTIEEAIRFRVRRVIVEFNDLFGKVIGELIAEGQSDPKVLQELYEQHIGVRRAKAAADIERGKVSGEFSPDTDAELLVDQIFGPIYYRMLLRITPLDQAFGDKLVDQVLRGVRGPVSGF